MKILLVSDTAPYSTYDVFKGYCQGFESLNIPFHSISLPDLLDNFSMEMCMGLTLSKLLIKDNKFSHIVFVAATMIPPWVYTSTYDKKVAVIATDDPHSSKMILENKDNIDYYFTCEMRMEDKDKQMYYLPTACTDFHLNAPKSLPDDRYASDVCFVGSVYPNRIKPLEAALEWCVENNKKMTLLGPIQGRTTYGELFVPEQSIIHKYGKHCIVDNKEATKYHVNANVVINMDRDTNWSPAFLKGNPHNVDVIPYSCNPRVYEVAACKTTQLYVNPRPEAKALFGDNIYTSTTMSVKKTLDEIFSTKKSVLNRKINKCYDIVKNGHTYTHRTAKLMEALIKFN